MSDRTVIEGCAIATVDAHGSEHASGHLVIEDGADRRGRRRARAPPATRATAGSTARACSRRPASSTATTTSTSGRRAASRRRRRCSSGSSRSTRRGRTSTPTSQAAAARAGLAALALLGLLDEHRPPLPLPARRRRPARRRGRRRARARRALPPLPRLDGPRALAGRAAARQGRRGAATRSSTPRASAIDRFHDPAPGAMTRIAVAPCSPFSVTRGADRRVGRARPLARRAPAHAPRRDGRGGGVLPGALRLPARRVPRAARLARRRRLARPLRAPRRREVGRFAETGTGVAHCPSSNGRLGAGIAPIADLRARRRRRSGSASTAPRRTRPASSAASCARRSCSARLRGGPSAMTAREALALGTIHGARCLGRADEIGSLEVGKRADVALWRIDDVWHAGIDDPVAALVLGATPRGRRAVRRGPRDRRGRRAAHRLAGRDRARPARAERAAARPRAGGGRRRMRARS